MSDFYFQIAVTYEQRRYSMNLADYSIEHHHVKDIYADEPGGLENRRNFRYTGTLGEVVFADTYGLPRPTKSFGAVDGQDYGQDFVLDIGGTPYSIDVKSMHRNSNFFHKDYVVNLHKYQIHKMLSKTDYYYCISIHRKDDFTYATFFGFVRKDKILNGEAGELFLKGTVRTRGDGTTFTFKKDTYEVTAGEMENPYLTDRIRAMYGFKIFRLKNH